MRAYYFGCGHGGGHMFYGPGLRRAYREGEEAVPWGIGVERLPPSKNGPEGDAALHHKDGWTALSVVDRTIDSRGGSHSTFCFEDTLTFERAVEQARQVFPQVVARFPFEIRLVAAMTEGEL